MSVDIDMVVNHCVLSVKVSCSNTVKKISELSGASPQSQSKYLRETGKFPSNQETFFLFLVERSPKARTLFFTVKLVVAGCGQPERHQEPLPVRLPRAHAADRAAGQAARLQEAQLLHQAA